MDTHYRYKVRLVILIRLISLAGTVHLGFQVATGRAALLGGLLVMGLYLALITLVHRIDLRPKDEPPIRWLQNRLVQIAIIAVGAMTAIFVIWLAVFSP